VSPHNDKEETVKKQERMRKSIASSSAGTHQPTTLTISMLSCARGGGDPAPPDPNPEAPPILDGKEN
jgi:hypothetical protein